MTTRVHIVNFGPDVVEVKASGNSFRIGQQASGDYHVYEGGDVIIKEVKEVKKVEEVKED